MAFFSCGLNFPAIFETFILGHCPLHLFIFYDQYDFLLTIKNPQSLSSCDLDVPVGDDDTDELKPKAERDTLLKRMESMWPLKSMARRKLMYQIGAVKRNGATAAKVGSQSTLTQEKDKGKDKLTSPKQVSLSYISTSHTPST